MWTDNYLTQEKPVDITRTFSILMRNVYAWMTLGLVITAFSALFVARSPEILEAIFTNQVLFWGLLIGELAMVIILSARINKMSFMTAGLLFAAYSILNGVTLSAIFVVYTMESIAQTFFVTAGTFGAMSLLGFFIKKDLSTIGRFLYMLLIGLIIATLANMFFQNEGLALLLNYAGVIIFTGLTAYDTQKIKKQFEAVSHMGITDDTNKLALMSSLELYLDFVNLFLYLLRFFGNRK